MEYLRIIQQIKGKVVKPIYLLFGEEPYYIDLISQTIESYVLDESEKEFNLQVFYGYDSDAQQIIAASKRYPMMASHQVVILREAQMMRDFEKLLPYVESPVPSTVLVLCYKYKKVDKRKALYKVAGKHGVVFESIKLRQYELPGWISSVVRNQGYRINDREAVLLADNLGNDLSKIGNELEKLFISIPQGTLISPDLIEQNIGISKEYNSFELQSAIAKKDIAKATKIALYMSENPKESPLIGIIYVLFYFFSRLIKVHFLGGNPNQQAIATHIGVAKYFVNEYLAAARNYPAAKSVEIIEMLRVYDLKAKGVDAGSASHSALLKELMFKIMH